MLHRSWLAAAALGTLLGCDTLTAWLDGGAPQPGESDPIGPDAVASACANLNELVGEPTARCTKDMGAFLAQCPDRSERVLACMASAADTTALDACTKPCVMAAADEIAPPVPAQLDTPRLDAACDAIALRSGDDNKANREACRRTLAQQVGRCPDIASKVLGCHAAARNEDAMTDCMLMCVTAEIAANP